MDVFRKGVYVFFFYDWGTNGNQSIQKGFKSITCLSPTQVAAQAVDIVKGGANRGS